MWPFSNKKPLRTLLRGFSDVHSHILAGVDDGVQTLEESLKILSEYEALGIKEVYLTPHIMEDIPNTPEELREKFELLQRAYNGPVELHLSAENMLDNLFEQRLSDGEFLPWGPEGDHLLVETSYYTPPMDFENLLQRIKSKGFTPLLAHPERYLYMDLKEYRHLRDDLGVRFQMNLFSLLGIYGTHAQKKAQMLLSKGFYSYAGTDLHSRRTLENLLDKKIDPRFRAS